MTIAIPGTRSALVRTDRDGKHRPASHPALKRREPWLPSAPSAPARQPAVAPTPPSRPIVVPELTAEQRAEIIARELRRRAHAAYKRHRYHTDPEYRARHIQRVLRRRETPEGRAAQREYQRRYYHRRYGR